MIRKILDLLYSPFLLSVSKSSDMVIARRPLTFFIEGWKFKYNKKLEYADTQVNFFCSTNLVIVISLPRLNSNCDDDFVKDYC